MHVVVLALWYAVNTITLTHHLSHSHHLPHSLSPSPTPSPPLPSPLYMCDIVVLSEVQVISAHGPGIWGGGERGGSTEGERGTCVFGGEELHSPVLKNSTNSWSPIALSYFLRPRKVLLMQSGGEKGERE